VLRHANGAFEVIVVENRPAGSEVEQSLRAAFGDRPEVRYVEQVQPGLSSARNAGLAAARGRYVAFIDDDITVDEYWMRSIRAAFASSRDLACLTGPILPSELHTEGQILLEQFAAFSKGLTRRRFNTASGQEIPLFPYAAGHFGSGANMVFRADVLRRIGGFDVHLGTGTSARGGEDLDICVRLIQAGETIMYEPDAIVWHRHPETLRSLRRQALGYGVGLGAMLTKHLVAGEDRLALVRMIPAGARYLVSRGSRKNAFKRAEFPASLTRIERLGLLWGPAAYLLSRSAGFRPVDVGAATGPGESSGSVWSGQVEWTDPKLPGGSLRTDAGDPFDHARLLVRVDGEPLGFVQIDLRDGELEPAAVRAEVERAFGPIPVAAGIASLACPERPAATVVLCTRNRPDGAERCVRALLAADCPRLELIVVDNAPSDDATERLIRRLAVDDPRVRYVCEPRPGLSVARNRGLREATGEIIAFTDDDVRVDAHWLKGLERGFARRPDVGCVTGLVASSSLQRPAERFFDERVWWSSGCEQRLYDLRGAAAAHGTAERSQLFPYAAGVFGTGANMAFRTAVLEQLGGFDECLGTGSPTGGGEDLDIFVRLLHAGWSISYEPAALVWHDHRVDMDELEKQMFGYGKGLAAYLCKYLFSRSCAVDVLTRAARGVWHLLVLGRRSRSAGDRAGFGVELQRAEWRGLVAGGPAYLRARRQSSPEHLRRVAPSKRVRARSGALGLR
jgi:GT2 family glycosyltransferase